MRREPNSDVRKTTVAPSLLAAALFLDQDRNR
jgi:hypothetical protein